MSKKVPKSATLKRNTEIVNHTIIQAIGHNFLVYFALGKDANLALVLMGPHELVAPRGFEPETYREYQTPKS